MAANDVKVYSIHYLSIRIALRRNSRRGRDSCCCVYFPCVRAVLRTRDVTMSDSGLASTPQPGTLHWGRRRWLLLAVFITYSLAYLDRANYGFGAAAGMAQTLHISNSQSAFLGSLFFLGYFLFQIPGASYARRKSATRLIFFALLGWGMLAALTGVVRTFWMLAVVRLLL